MQEKVLGKIESVSFGQDSDRPFLFGIFFEFSFGGSGASWSYTQNIGEGCKWDTAYERQYSFTTLCEYVDSLLVDAKVHKVEDLKNKPTEVTVEDNWVKGFRILTEVL